MTREDAERRASALNAQGSRGRWFARKGADGWNVVKVALPPGAWLSPVKEAAEVKRQTPGDGPPAFHRHFDGPYHV
jgi:hypothetical protein